MNRQTITAVIPAYNEEDNIARCLESLAWVDKLIVYSSGDDKTAEIAKSMGAEVRVYRKRTKPDFTLVQKEINDAIEKCQTDWLLRVDADEVVTEGLKREISTLLSNKSQVTNYPTSPRELGSALGAGKQVTSSKLQGTEDNLILTPVAYGVPRKQFFLGHFLKGGDWAYDRLVRLFKPQFCKYDPIVKVHEQFKVDGEVGYLQNPLDHYSHPNLKTLLQKFDIYTSLEAEELKISKLKAFGKMLFNPPNIFARWFFYHYGYRDGIYGILAGALRGYYDFLLYWKYLNT